MVGYSLTHIDGVADLAHFMNMSHHSEYLTVRMRKNHRQWFVSADYLFFLVRGFLSLWYMGKVIKMMINAFGVTAIFACNYIFLLRFRCFLPFDI